MAETKKTIKVTGGRKSSSARPSSLPKKVAANKRKQTRKKGTPRKEMRDMPQWLHILIAIGITGTILFFAYHLFFKQTIFRFAVCEGTKAYQTCMPKGYSTFGIDISRHQGKINWNRLKNENSPEAPITFAYIKATEGCNYKDPRFGTNWKEAKQHGFIRGAYHYFTGKSPGEAQADMYIRNVKLESGDLPPMVDIEEEPADRTAFIAELKKFILKLEAHYGVKPIIYSYAKYHNRYLKDDFFKEYDLWVAHYYAKSPNVKREWKMWQFTDIGRVPGIKERTDINVLNGGEEELQKLLIK